MVLVGGTPFHFIIWRPVILLLQDHFRVHWLDLPGYGGSDKYEGQDVRLRSFARVLAEWMAHKKLTDCHLGAMISAQPLCSAQRLLKECSMQV